MVLWVVLWSLDARPFDGAMLFLIIVLLAATGRMVAKLLPGNQDQSQANPDAAPFN
jgi:hypothetical protein